MTHAGRPLRTAADARVEAKAALMMCSVALLCILGPLVPTLVHGTTPGVLAFASAFPWVFNLWLFGWKKMQWGACAMFGGTRIPTVPTDEAHAFALGVGLMFGAKEGTVRFVPARTTPRPTLAVVLSTQDGTRDLPEHVGFAATTALSSEGAWDLAFVPGFSISFDAQGLTAHQKIAAQARVADAIAEAQRNTVPESRLFAALAKRFPGRMPA